MLIDPKDRSVVINQALLNGCLLNEARSFGRYGTKVCRYNWHSAGSLGWPFPTLKYKYIFPNKIYGSIVINSTRKLLWFKISEMLIAVDTAYCILRTAFSASEVTTLWRYTNTFIIIIIIVVIFIPQVV